MKLRLLKMLASIAASIYFFYLAFSPNIRNDESQFYSIILVAVITLITSIFIFFKTLRKEDRVVNQK